MAATASLTKITRPGLRNVYQRTRLFQWLDKATECNVIWIAGPPGAGKTTLICSYLEERAMPCLWYQIDKNDADIASFFHYLGLAVKKAAPHRRKPLPHLTPEYLSGLPTFSRRYFQEIFARLKSPFVVVIDDYQHVPNNSQIHEAIRDGLTELPPGGTLICISRKDPPTTLARTRANQDMAVLGWKELSLTADESRGIAKLWGVKQPVREILKHLHGKTEGWAAGLVMMLEGIKSGVPIRQNLGDTANDALFNYFASEILEQTEADVQDFLLRTAFLPSMTTAMCKQLTKNKDAGKILTRLRHNNFFTERHIKTEATYQYHPLFREFLLNQALEYFTPEELGQTYQEAAGILETNGQYEESVELLHSASDWQHLMSVCLQQAQHLLEQGRGATLERWIKLLPADLQENSPWLQYWLGATRLPFNLIESRQYYENAYRLFESQEDVAGLYLSWAGIVETYIYEWGNFSGLDAWIGTMENLLAQYPEFPSPEIQARVTAGMFSALVYRQPHHPDFLLWETRAHQILQSDLDIRHRVMLGNHLILHHSWMGDLAKAALVMDILRPAALAKDIAPLTLIIWRSMESMYDWLTLANKESLHAMDAGLEYANETGVHIWDFMLYAQGMYGAMNADDLDRGETLLKLMGQSMQSARRLDAAHYHYQAANLAMRQEDYPRAVELARGALARAQDSGSPFPQTLGSMALAQTLFERGEDQQAFNYLLQARNINRNINSHYIEYHTLLLEAYFRIAREDTEAGLPLLRQAFSLAADYGYMTMTWWRPDIMSWLCTIALQQDIEPEYIKQLILRQKLLPDPDDPDLDNWPWAVQLFTLGRFSVVSNNTPLSFSSRVQSKPLELLKILIAFGGREVSESRLVEALWPDADGDAAHRAFDTTLHRLRKLIGDDKVLVLQDGRLTLDPRYCWVDVWAFERLLGNMDAALRSGNSDTIRDCMSKGLMLYQGPFLGDAGNDMPWSLTLRDRLHSKFLRQLLAAGQHWESINDQNTAIEIYRRGLEIDPVAEELYQHLLAIYSALGRNADVLTTFQRCQQTLKSLLGVEPSPATIKLAEKTNKNK